MKRSREEECCGGGIRENRNSVSRGPEQSKDLMQEPVFSVVEVKSSKASVARDTVEVRAYSNSGFGGESILHTPWQTQLPEGGTSCVPQSHGPGNGPKQLGRSYLIVGIKRVIKGKYPLAEGLRLEPRLR